jgi:hypothetical protein
VYKSEDSQGETDININLTPVPSIASVQSSSPESTVMIEMQSMMSSIVTRLDAQQNHLNSLQDRVLYADHFS